jgi:nucleoside-diphosphate-sugar epimerase
MRKRVLIIGGLGFVGSRLVKKLITDYEINILDTGWFWEDLSKARFELNSGTGRTAQVFIGDIRNKTLVRRSMRGCDAVVHLACLSNDPSSELNPDLTKSINIDGNDAVIDVACNEKPERFIYASSSSVYGIQPPEVDVTEQIKLSPLTDYSKFKAVIENSVRLNTEHGYLNGIIVRPATVCGYSPRQRLDLVANIFVDQAINGDCIRVTGGDNYRPCLGISRMVDCYRFLLEGYLPELVGQTFNVGGPNYTVRDLAILVRDSVKRALGKTVDIQETTTNDNRSYRINSDKIKSFGFEPYDIQRDIQELIDSLYLYNNHKGTTNAPMLNLEKSKNIEVMKKLISEGLE